MKIFGFYIETKKDLKNQIEALNQQLDEKDVRITVLSKLNRDLNAIVEKYDSEFPFEMGQVVYDLQLRNAKGRYTKTKPSIEHSVINEVVVDKKNYFNLVQRYHSADVFKSKDDAVEHLDLVCMK